MSEKRTIHALEIIQWEIDVDGDESLPRKLAERRMRAHYTGSAFDQQTAELLYHAFDRLIQQECNRAKVTQ